HRVTFTVTDSGPGIPADGRVVSNFIVQALQNEPITLYGDGSQTRSFCYVSDLIEGFVRLMRTPDEVTGPINLGNATEFTIAQLAELVVELTNSQSRIVYSALPADDPRQRKPDTTLAEATLGWKAATPLAEGLKYTIAYFDSLLRRHKPDGKGAELMTKRPDGATFPTGE
ncbi:MAG: NAD-dependent epimerase/dehydratase family protein, partial [Gammaproteobacteria bacterium]